MFYHGFFLLLFFVSHPLRSLNGTQPKPATCSEMSAIWKCMCEIWGMTSQYKSRGPIKHLFSTTSEVTDNFNGLYIRNETWYRQLSKCVDNYKESPISSHMLWTLVHKPLKMDRHFTHRIYANSAFYFITRLRRRRSANGIQPNFAKLWIVNRANNLP